MRKKSVGKKIFFQLYFSLFSHFSLTLNDTAQMLYLCIVNQERLTGVKSLKY